MGPQRKRDMGLREKSRKRVDWYAISFSTCRRFLQDVHAYPVRGRGPRSAHSITSSAGWGQNRSIIGVRPLARGQVEHSLAAPLPICVVTSGGSWVAGSCTGENGPHWRTAAVIQRSAPRSAPKGRLCAPSRRCVRSRKTLSSLVTRRTMRWTVKCICLFSKRNQNQVRTPVTKRTLCARPPMALTKSSVPANVCS
jgi:hypothetical protein